MSKNLWVGLSITLGGPSRHTPTTALAKTRSQREGVTFERLNEVRVDSAQNLAYNLSVVLGRQQVSSLALRSRCQESITPP